jgi:hypothetical protein
MVRGTQGGTFKFQGLHGRFPLKPLDYVDGQTKWKKAIAKRSQKQGRKKN